MSEISKLKYKQRQLKSHVTRLQNYFNKIDPEEIDENTIAQLTLRRDKLEPIWGEFNNIQAEIGALLEEQGSKEFDIIETENFETSYFQLMADIGKTINKHNQINHVINSNRTSLGESLSNTQPENHRFSSNISNDIILPSIKLPTFNGFYDKWVPFRDAFSSLVHNNTSLTPFKKLYYLKSSLEGDAAEIIQSIEITDANYETAWDTLKEHYEDKRSLVENHVSAICEFPRIQKESYNDLNILFFTIIKNLKALQALNESVDTWDTILVHIITRKFDVITSREWEEFSIEMVSPKISDIYKFLKHKCSVLNKFEKRGLEKKCNIENRVENKNKLKSHSHVSTKRASCYFCKGDHSIYYCEAFLKYPVTGRINQIKKLNLCVNCLRSSHAVTDCQLRGCKKCSKKHNTLLHFDKAPAESTMIKSDNQDPEPGPSGTAVTSGHVNNLNTQVLLSTAVIQVRDVHGSFHRARALLDSGSQSNFITEKLCKDLGLNCLSVDYSIMGVGQALAGVKYKTNITIQSSNNQFIKNISCLVLPKITEQLPCISFNSNNLNIPQDIQLADPEFNSRGTIDLLLGANIFWELLKMGQIHLGKNKPILQETQLGWVVSGNVNLSSFPSIIISCLNVKSSSIDEQLSKFWNIEEINPQKIYLSKSEQFCENHFLKNTERDNTGRFIVSIPLMDNASQLLGQSRNLTLNRFKSLEKHLDQDSNLKHEYVEFMSEYEKLGHMSKLPDNNVNGLQFYLPHHAVVKESSITTKVRVVFDASMKSDTGFSLNDVQYYGPTIQSDLISIILRFLKHRYVISVDISKMYRQILIKPEQRSLQRIFWRSNSNAELQCYELNTVTYGTASAPFLHQLAVEHEISHPKASDVIKNDIYVDDLLTGADTCHELLQIQVDVSKILNSGCFEMRKWLSNRQDLFEHFQTNSNLNVNILQLGESEANKTLGIFWNATSDTIQYSININCANHEITKRTILSVTSQIFDPLGLLGPIVIVAKLIIQKLWQAKLSWDEIVPPDINTRWRNFISNLTLLNEIRVPRWILVSDTSQIELPGFSDASEAAYGACVYIRCENKNGIYTSNLLCAKSRVAPLKRISLPRLELCGALLLANLINKVMSSIKMSFDRIYLWTDSTITLCWIRASPSRWKTFVANRVSDIQSLTNVNDWHHVKSSDNPADFISRGIDSSQLLNCTLWWNGPSWFQEENSNWTFLENYSNDSCLEIPEQKLITNLITVPYFELDIITKYSRLLKLQRVFGYCMRFISNIKLDKTLRQSGPLTTSELRKSLNQLVKFSQIQSFGKDYVNLLNNKPVDKNSKLLSLNPFLDEMQLLRVGGRLQNSHYNYDKKHPIILDSKHYLTKLILRNAHIKLLHCGPQQLLASIRETYWPISGRALAREIVRKCITCFKVNPSNEGYLMGNLPEVRSGQYSPFHNTGVDYAGPFFIRDRKLRGSKLIKGYVCLFVCFSTKAVHLELVTALTTEAFLAVLKRFISRRGKPLNIYSDNAKNFVGADRKLKELSTFFERESNALIDSLSKDNISWHFIPPKSPNFGGLWEAGISKTKFHLKRVLSEANLTYEDFNTVLIQIEAVLNSRPLSPLSSEPTDDNPLTPAHFLIGKSLTAFPEPSISNIQESRLTKYKRAQHLVEHFWKRWSKEYVSELQIRTKWKQHHPSLLKVGSLVLIKEDNLPPLRWQLGRVIQFHPGADNIIRVVSVKVSSSGVIKRAVSKLCVLPTDDVSA